MSELRLTEHPPHDKAERLSATSQSAIPRRPGWRGPTYYGRPQLKAAPFNKALVGGYIFLAGLSGAAALLAGIADRRAHPSAQRVARRGRYVSLLAATIGPLLLIADLHTPKRFYNMLRIAKPTSPMSIGSWNLVTFSAFAGLSAAAQFLADYVPGLRFLRGLARASQIPAAAAGAGLSTYTASLLSATSTPAWAAAPKSLAVRFGASSVASAAAALALCEESGRTRRTLENVACAALLVEGMATMQSHNAHRERGIAAAWDGAGGRAERLGAIGLGLALPLGLYAASRLLRERPLSDAASLAVLAGSLILRISTLEVGAESARRPEVSFRFAEPRQPGASAMRLDPGGYVTRSRS